MCHFNSSKTRNKKVFDHKVSQKRHIRTKICEPKIKIASKNRTGLKTNTAPKTNKAPKSNTRPHTLDLVTNIHISIFRTRIK